ncbi:hypothetical protein [Saccharicrinis sp. FJH54]|uniref:TackOD1 domain-containing metal-binding protein n=1 Tax=Saccharicrinis sp. FJH54 TaxID=3344665 RepID=UPI0035D47C08
MGSNEQNAILSNSEGRLILLVTSPATFNLTDIEDNAVDAVAIDLHVEFTYETGKVIEQIRTSNSKLTYLVPVFLFNDPDEIPERYLELTDGIVRSPNDPKIGIISERINKSIEELPNISLPPYSTRIITKAFRFLYTRKKELRPIIDIGNVYGYVYPFIDIHISNDQSAQEILPLLTDAVSEGYLSSTFMDRVHLCPDCFSVYHNIRELCPSCTSAQLKAENIMHHFVCAYVGPESDFVVDGSLVCPKCKKVCRHIGVDYDKPSVAYECQDCKQFFQEPVMEAFCMNCKSHNKLEDLLPYDIHSFKLTPLGKEIAKSGISSPTLKDETFFPGFIPYNIFTTYLQFEIDRTKRYSSCTIVGSINLRFTQEDVLSKQQLNKLQYEISEIILKSSPPSSIFSFKNNTFMFIVPDEFQFKIEKQLSDNVNSLSKVIDSNEQYKGKILTNFKIHEIEEEDSVEVIVNKMLSS